MKPSLKTKIPSGGEAGGDASRMPWEGSRGIAGPHRHHSPSWDQPGSCVMVISGVTLNNINNLRRVGGTGDPSV